MTPDQEKGRTAEETLKNIKAFLKLDNPGEALECLVEAITQAQADTRKEIASKCTFCRYQAEHVGNFEGHLCPHLTEAYETGFADALEQAAKVVEYPRIKNISIAHEIRALKPGVSDSPRKDGV